MPFQLWEGIFLDIIGSIALHLNKSNTESNFRACVERDEELGFIQLGKVSLQAIKSP